ncbi:peptidase M12A, astacin [Candidatus Koribacter versatilis Ellin345]|uniref:Peptidase M12A, astacin n=1 Tax=Koribacter versatilis (strain Ellin345) TaxID=204669 RepID=Q1IIQ1_KORVE|nr:peptidase M12A, astacin [Candidatus Koribacter versatilis]ABF43249.1 peptidase M12A, astacin [Candidatus Koribacter versatilis Ellin345]
MFTRSLCGLMLVVVVASTLFAQEIAGRLPTVESLPDRVQARIEVRTRAAGNAHNAGRFGMQYFMFITKRWPNAASTPITVAFLGGDRQLRQRIQDTVTEWSQAGTLRFDFIDPASHTFREWSRSDTSFKANIRVAFDGSEEAGYWSMIGVDSSDPTIIKPGEASLMLQGFTTLLPQDWQATVRHEFGHALGLLHEHQIPVGGCDQDFRWEDDTGYVPTQDSYGQYITDAQGRRPGIYTLLAGAPNFWQKDKVNSNMRQLATDSHNKDFGAFDAKSIMKYYFDPSFFRDGTAAHCYSDENLTISDEDKQGIAKWYPPFGSQELSNLLKLQQDTMRQLAPVHNMQQVQTLQSIK